MSDPNLNRVGRPRPITLGIVGASARAAADSALRAGVSPVATDLFNDSDLLRKCPASLADNYPLGCAEWLARTDVDGWLYTGALENHPDLIERMSRLRPLWGNSANVLRAVRSPLRVAAALTQAGLLFPETRPANAEVPRDGQWLTKTYQGASGSGVRRWDAHAPLPGRPRDFVFQRSVAGLPVAALYVAARGDAVLWGVTEQLVGEAWTHAGPFQYCGSVGPWIADSNQRAAIRAVGETLAAQFNLVGLFGVDLIAAADGVWTIEVNPRYTASVEVLERLLEVRSMDWHLRACRGGTLPRVEPVPQSRFVGKVILFARQPVRVSDRFAAWADAGSQQEPDPSVADVPHAGSLIAARRPVVTLFASGCDAAAVRDELRQKVYEAEAVLYGN